MFNWIRFFDLLASVMGFLLLWPLLLIVIIICFLDTGSPFYFQRRLGVHKSCFVLVKFRTMKIGNASTLSHLVDPSGITSVGRILRRYKIDEIPQLWNVFKGEMSLVGPRPGLPCHQTLTKARENLDLFRFRPGITGLSQVNNIDMSTPEALARSDSAMMSSFTLKKYFYYILISATGKGRGDSALINNE